MISRTTKPDESGWYHTFRKNKDGTIVIQQKNKKYDIHRCIYIYNMNGEAVLDAFYEVIHGEP